MDPKKLMGYAAPGDEKVPVSTRDWKAMKLALWRSRALSEISVREALAIINRCVHLQDCPGAETETEPCFSPTYGDGDQMLTEGCPDREQRMSALVIVNAARQLAPADARRPAAEPFYAPSREYYSEILAALATADVEIERLRSVLRAEGISEPTLV